MKHIKTYEKETLMINGKATILEGPVTKLQLETMTFDEGLNAFREPIEQFEAIQEISTLDEGRIYIIRVDQHIIGYVTYLYPDPMERWSNGNLPYLLELGAIEISLPYRSYGLGRELLKLSTRSPELENYIIITTEYYWHWDLKNSGLDVFEYKKLMQRMMANGGLEVFATDDPEITSHPANSLMARIGKNITVDQMRAFDDLRYMNRFFF
ncbi:GNAT family N-acetyltransferase [Staphylococcus chromogenes]|uniref:GNAT family N-acetyltransferase n=1 Tax=Staphylococcus chromogenes TaxID=46126 RepID=UPI0021D103F7|nr:GNAT family N-acetyltransferase [Staphylococcus chromogenes]UXS76444.1 GNAT family N-acetyltransferase [Staphylococcus chromogenes]